MTALAGFGSVVRVVVSAHAKDQLVLNVLHYKFTTTGGDAATTSIETITGAVQAAWVAQFIPLLPADYLLDTVTGIEIVDFQSTIAGTPPRAKWTIGVQSESITIPARPGAQDEPSGSTFEAAAIKKISAIRSRRYRGGMRLGPLAESTYTENDLEDTFHTALQTNANAFLATTIPSGNGADSLGLAVLSGSAAIAAAVLHAPATDYASLVLQMRVGPFVTSQVSRKRRNVYH